MRGLYAIVDTDALHQLQLDPIRFAEAVLQARPAAVQLRDKRGGAAQTLALLRELAPRARAADVTLYANDRPDLAALAGCDGVHLGQQDMAPHTARLVFASMGHQGRVGMSVHDEHELRIALAADPDYIAFGPVYDTRNKVAAEPTIGIDGLRKLTEAAAQATQTPFVAIGGIDLERAAAVADVCPCVASIGALLPTDATEGSPYDQVTRRARQLVATLSASHDSTQGRP